MKKNEKIIIIGNYPDKGDVHAERILACAAYTKDTLLSIQKATNNNVDIAVLADIIRKRSIYEENGIKVRRIWNQNSFLTFPKIFIEIFKKHQDAKRVALEFEVMTFGKVFYLIPLPFFNLALRVIGKELTFICHHVIKDIRDFEGHVGIRKDSPRTWFVNLLISLFYKLTLFSVNKVIVFDEELKNVLKMFSKKSNIEVVPLAFKPLEINISREEARNKLGIESDEFVILCFGYLAWYKGSDWVVEAFKHFKKTDAGRKAKLIIAGGAGVKNREKKFYKEYVERIKNECRKNNILLTGFVEESDIPLYYQAADLSLFPYRIQMSSSGPLSLAFSFRKPVLLSDMASKTFLTGKAQEFIEKEKLTTADLSFKLNYSDLARKLGKIIQKPEYALALQNISSQLAQERSWEKVGQYHIDYIFEDYPQKRFFPALRFWLSRS